MDIEFESKKQIWRAECEDLSGLKFGLERESAGGRGF
jgi:hypothetical protein